MKLITRQILIISSQILQKKNYLQVHKLILKWPHSITILSFGIIGKVLSSIYSQYFLFLLALKLVLILVLSFVRLHMALFQFSHTVLTHSSSQSLLDIDIRILKDKMYTIVKMFLKFGISRGALTIFKFLVVCIKNNMITIQSSFSILLALIE